MRNRVLALLGPAMVFASTAGASALSRVAPGDRPDISADGRYVSFSTGAALLAEDTNGLDDIYVYDRATRTLTRASVSSAGVQGTVPDDTDGRRSAISADGGHVAFDSTYPNLVPGDA